MTISAIEHFFKTTSAFLAALVAPILCSLVSANLALVKRFESFIRSIGLGITTITKGPELAKPIVVRSAKVALSRCGVHILPSCVSIVLITFNLLGYYIGPELQGISHQDSVKNGVLQICAKAQELLVVASLSMVLFHVLRYELVFGPGLPYGLIGAGFSFTEISFFWSSDFWASIKYKHPSKARKFGLFALIVISGTVAVLAGPVTAVLMIPRMQSWPIGGSIFWLNGTSDHMYPETVAIDPHTDCGGTLWLSDPRCAANGYQSLAETFRTWKTTGVDGFASFEVTDLVLRKTIIARARSPWTSGIETWAVTSHAPTAMMQAAAYSMWDFALGVLINQAPHEPLNPFFLTYDAQRTVSVETHLPAIRVDCNDDIDTFYNATSHTIYAKFPILPEHETRWAPAFNDTAAEPYQSVEVTAAVLDRISGTDPALPINGRASVSVSINGYPGQAASIGLILLSPINQNHTQWNLQACAVDARWAAGQSLMEMNARTRQIPYDMDGDSERVVMGVQLDDPGFGWDVFRPASDGSWKRAVMSNEWFQAFNPVLPPYTGLTTGAALANQTTIDYVLNTLSLAPLGDHDTTYAYEVALASMVADGISRTPSSLTNDYAQMFGQFSNHPINLTDAKKFVRLGSPLESFRPATVQNLTQLQMNVSQNGLAIAAIGWFDYFCIAILLLHALIALTHAFWVVFKSKETSDAWESIPELMALGINSERPQATGVGLLNNTSAGIRTWVPLQSIVQVQLVEQGGKEAAQLRFRDTASDVRYVDEIIEVGKSY